jgi:transcription elongation factor Elf1
MAVNKILLKSMENEKMKKKFKQIIKCPVCGEDLVVIDDMNYMTMICPNCHSTIFEEFDNTVHIIKNGIMKDGYNASLDIFYKQFIAYLIYVRTLSSYEQKEFWTEKKFIGMINNEDIMADGIYDYFVDMVGDFKMRQPCIYFKGYEKYLEMSKPEAEKFKRLYL